MQSSPPLTAKEKKNVCSTRETREGKRKLINSINTISKSISAKTKI